MVSKYNNMYSILNDMVVLHFINQVSGSGFLVPGSENRKNTHSTCLLAPGT